VDGRFHEVKFRSCFWDRWGARGGIEVKSCAKRRLERKIKLDWDRQQGYEEDVRGVFGRNKKLPSRADRDVKLSRLSRS
jgi:hypothetical protein